MEALRRSWHCLCYDEETYVDMPLVRCAEKEVYENHLLQAVRNKSELADNARTTHCLAYIAFSRGYTTLHLLNNFEYSCKEMQFEQRFCVHHNAALFANWNWVDIFVASTHDDRESFVQVPSW